MADLKQTVSQRFGFLKQPSITTFSTAGNTKFSREKTEDCYKAAAEVIWQMKYKYMAFLHSTVPVF